jgi:hypothetical protein
MYCCLCDSTAGYLIWGVLFCLQQQQTGKFKIVAREERKK